MVKRIAIIPARGGSKRIKNKNIKDFCGRPMIHYIIDTALECELFEKIHVSTDCPKIKETVQKNNLKIDFMRPDSLADDHTPIMPVLSFVINKYLEKNLIFDEIWLLYACSPLIDSSDLISASKLFSTQLDFKKPLLAVAEYPVPIEWSFFQKDDGQLVPRFPGKFLERSQDLECSYFDSGTFAIFTKNNIKKQPSQDDDSGFIGFRLPKKKAIDIDSEEDWEIAEAIYSHIQKQTNSFRGSPINKSFFNK
tara:strand:- start:284 stop:1036 length:753 start_codon:yes stop_codon:yes gene_type:complete